MCWECYLVQQAAIRTTLEGKARATEAIAKFLATTAGKAYTQTAKATWRKKYPEKAAAHSMKRRAAKLQRIPPWADLVAIKAFYTEAQRLTKLTGVKYVVDHIIPLRGKRVSGLHVETNLQVITKKANSEKGNKYEG